MMSLEFYEANRRYVVAVRIRMKKLGRKHRPFFRICAVDSRAPRDGRVLEELGTYDPMIPETDARAALNNERFAYWLGVGAQMSDRVKVLFKKYGPEGTHLEARESALAKRSGPRVLPDFGAPAYVPSAESEAPEAEEASAASEGDEAANDKTEVAAEVATAEVATDSESSEADVAETDTDAGASAESTESGAEEGAGGEEAAEEDKSE